MRQSDTPLLAKFFRELREDKPIGNTARIGIVIAEGLLNIRLIPKINDRVAP